MISYLRYRRVHISWHITALCSGIIVGVTTSQYATGFFGHISWLIIATVLFGFVCWKQRLGLVVLACSAGILLGLWRGSLDQLGRERYDQFYGMTAVVEGKVREDVDLNKRNQVVIRLADVTVNSVALPGSVLVATDTSLDIKRGDHVRLRGRLAEGFGGFASSVNGAVLLGVERPEPGDLAVRVRDWFAEAVKRAIPEPQASLGIGYILGQRRALPEQLNQALQLAGLTHIVVASGYNLTILVRLARRLFEKVSRYLAVLSAGGMTACFIAISGISPSMSRAGLVTLLALAAWYYGRSFHPVVLLAVVAAMTLLVSPSFGWGDLGWQLSFAAFAGVMILAPLVQAYFFGGKKLGTLRQIVGETVSAQIATLPILMLAFGQLNNIALIANILVLPLVPLAMGLTFVAGLAGLVAPSTAVLVGLPAAWLLDYMINVANVLSELPWAVSDVTIQLWQTVLLYGAIVGASLYMWRKTGYDFRSSSIVE